MTRPQRSASRCPVSPKDEMRPPAPACEVRCPRSCAASPGVSPARTPPIGDYPSRLRTPRSRCCVCVTNKLWLLTLLPPPLQRDFRYVVSRAAPRGLVASMVTEEEGTATHGNQRHRCLPRSGRRPGVLQRVGGGTHTQAVPQTVARGTGATRGQEVSPAAGVSGQPLAGQGLGGPCAVWARGDWPPGKPVLG